MKLDRLQRALQTGNWGQAADILTPLVAGADPHPSMMYNYGKVLFELGRMAQAQAMLRRTVQVMPEHSAAWFELGRAALSAEDFETGFEAFSRALDLEPTDTDARRNLGRVGVRLGRFGAAQAAWSELRGDPEADLALYRIAAETGAPNTSDLRRDLLDNHPDKAAVIRTLVRVSKGSVPLSL